MIYLGLILTSAMTYEITRSIARGNKEAAIAGASLAITGMFCSGAGIYSRRKAISRLEN